MEERFSCIAWSTPEYAWKGSSVGWQSNGWEPEVKNTWVYDKDNVIAPQNFMHPLISYWHHSPHFNQLGFSQIGMEENIHTNWQNYAVDWTHPIPSDQQGPLQQVSKGPAQTFGVGWRTTVLSRIQFRLKHGEYVALGKPIGLSAQNGHFMFHCTPEGGLLWRNHQSYYAHGFYWRDYFPNVTEVDTPGWDLDPDYWDAVAPTPIDLAPDTDHVIEVRTIVSEHRPVTWEDDPWGRYKAIKAWRNGGEASFDASWRPLSGGCPKGHYNIVHLNGKPVGWYAGYHIDYWYSSNLVYDQRPKFEWGPHKLYTEELPNAVKNGIVPWANKWTDHLGTSISKSWAQTQYAIGYKINDGKGGVQATTMADPYPELPHPFLFTCGNHAEDTCSFEFDNHTVTMGRREWSGSQYLGKFFNYLQDSNFTSGRYRNFKESGGFPNIQSDLVIGMKDPIRDMVHEIGIRLYFRNLSIAPADDYTGWIGYGVFINGVIVFDVGESSMGKSYRTGTVYVNKNHIPTSGFAKTAWDNYSNGGSKFPFTINYS